MVNCQEGLWLLKGSLHRPIAAKLNRCFNELIVFPLRFSFFANFTTGQRTPLWEVPEGVIVDPRDVMHKDLADFYMQAVVATKLSRCTPFYRLHGFGECKVSNVNVLWVRTLSYTTAVFDRVGNCVHAVAAGCVYVLHRW